MRIDAPQATRRGVGLTPLIDVVFLLLLFFMLASSFARHATIEVGIGDNAPAGTETAPMILLAVGPGARYRVNGVETPAAGIAEALRAAAGDDTHRILVRPGADATAQDIVGALEAASGAGVGDVVLLR